MSKTRPAQSGLVMPGVQLSEVLKMSAQPAHLSSIEVASLRMDVPPSLKAVTTALNARNCA